MNRMTCYFDADIAVLRDQCTFDRESSTEPDDCISCWELCEEKNNDCDECQMQKALNKLAEYEDLEEQGKLMKLPCAVGDTVYRINESVIPMIVIGVAIRNENELVIQTKEITYGGENLYKNSSIGKNVFLTQEAAEAALKES